MNLTIIGATGMVGSCLITEALHRGHRVTAASRHPEPDSHREVRTLRVDATTGEGLNDAVTDADALVLSIRATPGQEDGLNLATQRVLDATAHHEVPVLIIGGAGALRSPNDPSRLLVDDPTYVPEAWKPLATAGIEQLRTCQTHPHAKWTYLSPPAILEPGERTGTYRRGTTTLLTADDGTSHISAEDLGHV